jgi:NAD(P)-dependent dehydrogenase (short-subunit alcohol dehydrogenase family)
LSFALTFLKVLINNAASPYGPFKLTVDNLESQMATNHFGPFLFTKLLAPKLLASGTATYTPRVIFVSSMAHAMVAGVNFSTLKNPDPEKFRMQDVYGQTKSANILTAIELSKRSEGKLNAYSLHPGSASPIHALMKKSMNDKPH